MRILILLLAIRGTVLDPSGRPIEGAQIECGSKTVYTNNEGLFAIPDVPDCHATVTKSGFVPATPTLSETAPVQLTMTLQGPLDTAIVTATGAETTPEQAGISASVFTAHDFAVRDFPMVPDALREMPGIQVSNTSRRGGLTEIYTRGAERTGTLVLLDGVPMNDPGGELHTESISSVGIDRMEVIRGPESALFGAEAAAGVIQLFTSRGNTEDRRPHIFASYERGNFDTDRWTSGISGGSGSRIDYSLSAEQLHTGGEFQNDFYRDTTGTANIGYRISPATVARGIFRMYDAHVGTPDQVGFGLLDQDANEETRNKSVTFTVDDTRSARFFQHFWFGYNHLSDRFNDNVGESYNVAALARDLPDGRTYFVSLLQPPFPVQAPAGLTLLTASGTLYPFSSLNLTERELAGYQGTYSQSGGTLVFGYEYQHQAGNLSGLVASREHHGLYLNEQKTVGKRLFLSAGARFEHSSAFGSQFIPRGAASLLLFGEHGALSSSYFRVSAGRGITEPSLLENFAVASFYHGNPTLKPEVTKSYEAGVVQEWFGHRVRTEVSAFRSSFTNLINFVVDTWQNVDISWARGVEATVGMSLPGHVRFDTTYMRLYTRAVTAPFGELYRRPRNSGAMTLSWTPRRWSFIAGGRIVGDRRDTEFTFFAINRNQGYENVYASGSFDLTKNLTATIRLDNLLNEQYQEVLGYTSLSRTAIGGLRIKW